jgi:unsaturated rhamnogalacturonyl hydrolase
MITKHIAHQLTLMFLLLLSLHSVAQKKGKELYSPAGIKGVMEKVCNWQLANPVSFNAKNENDWARAAFYTGVMATYRTTQNEKYLNEAIKWAESFDFMLAERLRHADDQAKGQTYLEIYELKKDPSMIADIKSTYDSMIMSPRPGREDWWWCDALFMAPPVMARLSAATGDQKYLDSMDMLFWDTHDFLFDKDEHLFYRDASFIDKRTPSGKKMFWARGNGWVMGGTVRVLQYMPKDYPAYNKYVSLLREMAKAVKLIQSADGLWRPSLLDPKQVPHPETSGSAFFCYALAWGINNGILDRKEFLPVVRKAWEGLNRYVSPEGKLQWVQPIGASPDKVTIDNFQEYGSGAFLLAASEVYKLKN